MKENELNHVEIDGVNYPFIYSINVMATLQKKYGSIQAWADVVEPKPKKKGEKVEPDLDALIFFFTEAFNEGIEVENESKNENRSLLTSRQVGRLVTKLGLANANEKLKEAVINAQPEKPVEDESKNVNPTQNQ